MFLDIPFAPEVMIAQTCLVIKLKYRPIEFITK